LSPALTDQRFDAIFLSNIPDYVGGQLPIVLYGLPILKETNKEAFVNANFLLHTGYYSEGYENTLAEFFCMSNKEAAEQLLGLNFKKTKEIEEAYFRTGSLKPEFEKFRSSMEWMALLTPHRYEHLSLNAFVLPDKTNFSR